MNLNSSLNKLNDNSRSRNKETKNNSTFAPISNQASLVTLSNYWNNLILQIE